MCLFLSDLKPHWGTHAGPARAASGFLHAQVLLCLEGFESLVSSTLPDSHTLSTSSSTKFSENEEEDLMETSLWGQSIQRSLTLSSFSSCEFLYLFSSAAQGSFSDDG